MVISPVRIPDGILLANRVFSGYNVPGTELGTLSVNDSWMEVDTLMDLTKYERNAYVAPFWKSGLMLHESFWPVGDGELTVTLLFPADEILSVRSADLQTVYEEGRDYLLRDGKLVIPEDSTIVRTPRAGYISPDPLPNVFSATGFAAVGGGWLFFGESKAVIEKQYAVTYRHSAVWDGPMPPRVLSLLPKTARRLQNGESFTVGFFGDSITTGANSSAVCGCAPYAEMWPVMVASTLAERAGTDLPYINKAVGGTTADWGAKTFCEAFPDRIPELLFLAFGMNDGSGKRPAADYIADMRSMIRQAREKAPSCEIVLIATTLPNPDAATFGGPHEEYEPALLSLAKEFPCVAALPLTSFHKALLARKPFRDMTGNNINHPNDFLARIYASYILSALEDKA